MEIDLHVVQNQPNKGFIVTKHVSSKDRPFTKSLGASILYRLLSKMKISSYLSSSCEGDEDVLIRQQNNSVSPKTQTTTFQQKVKVVQALNDNIFLFD